MLINNAGLGGEVPVVDMTDAQWSRVLDVTLTSVFRMTRAFLPSMYARKTGVIVNNASVLGWRAQKGQAHYAAAKAGDGVIRKYNGRALLVTTGSCAIHCRYCFRRHFPYAEETAAAGGWQGAIDLIRTDASIEEVILSGGDPWSLATHKLVELTDALAAVPHLRRLRIHTRLPVVLPERVDGALLAWLDALPWPVTVVLHANHANEFDGHVDAALGRLRSTGAQLLNQAVLLRGVNDSVDALAELSERGLAAGLLPYYLHQLDRVQGAAHFEVDDDRAKALHTALSARLSGYLVPRLVREVAGDTGKRPL